MVTETMGNIIFIRSTMKRCLCFWYTTVFTCSNQYTNQTQVNTLLYVYPSISESDSIGKVGTLFQIIPKEGKVLFSLHCENIQPKVLAYCLIFYRRLSIYHLLLQLLTLKGSLITYEFRMPQSKFSPEKIITDNLLSNLYPKPRGEKEYLWKFDRFIVH